MLSAPSSRACNAKLLALGEAISQGLPCGFAHLLGFLWGRPGAVFENQQGIGRKLAPQRRWRLPRGGGFIRRHGRVCSVRCKAASRRTAVRPSLDLRLYIFVRRVLLQRLAVDYGLASSLSFFYFLVVITFYRGVEQNPRHIEFIPLIL